MGHRHWRAPRHLAGHTNLVLGVAFNHDGSLLASASADRTVRLWETGTGQPRGQPLAGHTDAVFGVAFNHDGTLLATASGVVAALAGLVVIAAIVFGIVVMTKK